MQIHGQIDYLNAGAFHRGGDGSQCQSFLDFEEISKAAIIGKVRQVI